MPRKTKEQTEIEKEENKRKSTKKATTTAKKTTTKKAETKKSPAKKKTTTKTSATKKTATTKAKTGKTSSTKKTTSKKSTTKKSTSSKKTTTKKKPEIVEYYDLPYRYNQTVVKVLAQTPNTLFIYWDISDKDRKSFEEQYGENFFEKTKPVLIVRNDTLNYSFEVEINDFANSWYIRTGEPNSDYIIELGRRSNINNNEYIYINSSNEMASPNDHILFENIDLGNVLFKNVKTSKHAFKDFGDLKFINDIDKLYGNIYNVYSALYDDELLNELTNPSSGEFYLKK